MAGSQYMELDWNQPITTNGTSVYFADDGGGLQLPANWQVQYWDGTEFTPVTNASSYPEADNVFNARNFRLSHDNQAAGGHATAPTAGGVGAIQWVVPSIP